MEQVFDFLRKLRENNRRDWFLSHKSDYEKARETVVFFTEQLLVQMADFEPKMLQVDAEKSLYRIYRDTRFSADKSPYKTHFGVRLGNGKKHFEARYYLHIQPNECFLAGGIYMPEKERLESIRKKISRQCTDFRQDNKLKRLPSGFDKNDPMADYLKLKNFVAICPISEADFLTADAPRKFAQIYQSLKPINDFLEGD
ncbi:DUF2461 domain-containing protein [Capnocytophaga sp.]|uniref:DUF2461 domain-containing protein n=1 Tax=Capnocytophaga sp. TaxID=44737 RepID=UPI0026DC3BD4|nr:DUF2461 domain-containing protein [Capnocytophaga sp.]MDO5105172.1 DUF2461 domain-containing protein [Capnocytophaga sp.]